MLRFFLADVVYGLKLNVIPVSEDHIIQWVLGKIPMDQDVNVIPGAISPWTPPIVDVYIFNM